MSFSKLFYKFPLLIVCTICFAGCSKNNLSNIESNTGTTALTSNECFVTLSDGNCSVDGSNITVENDTLTISEEGIYHILGSLSDGQIIVDAADKDVEIILDNVTISNDSSAALYVKEANHVILTLAEDSTNYFYTTGEYVAIDDNNINSCIYAKDDLTICGDGTLTVEASYGHGISCKDFLEITGGDYVITAEKHGFDSNDGLLIEEGNFVINTQKDGMHTSAELTINGGTIDIQNSCEGLEGNLVTINDGEIHIVATDDGINASSDSTESSDNPMAVDETCEIIINGGLLTIDAKGDGIDSNGSILITGGEIYIEGPEDNGNGAIDYASEATVTGGILVATGMNGMAENFSNASTQCCMLVDFSSIYTDEIVLTDQNGTILLQYKPTKSYNCVYLSCPEISVENTYTVAANSEYVSVEMTETIYGRTNGGFGNGNMQRPDGMQMPDNMQMPGEKPGNMPPNSSDTSNQE